MDMMKDMYDKGDDTMKKTIGEAMMKARQTQQNPGLPDDPMDMPGGDMGGDMGGMGGF